MTIQQVFENSKNPLISYLMVGDGGYDKSLAYAKFLLDSGVDMLELGVPFSDPVADGEIILKAGQRALKNGADINMVFDMAKALNRAYDVPLVIMSYLNPIFCYGYDRFFSQMAKYGIEAVIIPDLPYEERGEIEPYLKQYDVKQIAMVALNTGETRLKAIAANSSGFVYLVAVKGITGTQRPMIEAVGDVAKAIKGATKTPVVAGFGIKSSEDIEAFHQIVDGIVIASEFIRLREEGALDSIRSLIRTGK
jgi:tryptophan synthase alpha chain